MASKEKKPKTKKINVFRLIVVSFLLISFIVTGTGIGIGLAIAKNIPKWEPSDFSTNETTFVYDSKGKEVTKLHAGENRTPVNSLDEVPDNIVNAFLAIEDIRFYDHMGIDFRALARSVVANIRGGFGSQGASTITQQLVRNAMLSHEKKLERKVQEIILAVQVERKYTKDEIFTHYLNWVYFGHGAYGIKAAADTYFGKELTELTLAESATLAGLVQRPNALSPYRNPEGAKNRRAAVLNNMANFGFISEADAKSAKEEEFNLPGIKQASHPYPYFIDYVVDQAEQLLEENGVARTQLRTGGLRVYTTLDPTVQSAAEKALSNKDFYPAPRPNEEHPVQGAMAVVDHRTGEVRALVGGRDHVTERGLNRATQGLRQPASAFKPIAAYGPALELGYGPGSILDDVPLRYTFGGQVYQPTNLGGNYRGLVTMREALTRSYNVTAVDLLHTIGVQQGYDFARNLGIPLTNDDKVLGMALGGLTRGVSPLNMAAAFGAFGNHGIFIEPHVITKITDKNGNVIVEVPINKKVVMSEESAYLMTDMLKSVVDSGTGGRARLGNRPVAGKTGTAELPPELRGLSGNRDAWFVGYTPELAAAVWIGYDKTDKNHYLYRIYGGNHPAMMFKATMEEALKNVPVTQFSRPSSIVSVQIDAKSGLPPSELTPEEYIITELFARKNVPTEISNAWVREEVCAESGLLPSEYCPTVSKVFLQRPKPFVPFDSRRPADANLEIPTEVCTLHNPETSVVVDICTDSEHEGRFYRAIIGPDGTGCPEDSIIKKAFPKGKEPREYCNIPSHQVGLGDLPSKPDTDSNTLSPIGSVRGQLSVSQQDGEDVFAVTLNWDHSRIGDVEYFIYRSTKKGFEPNENNRLNPNTKVNTTSYTDTNNLQLNQTYYYKIIAFNHNNETKTNPSPELTITVKR